MRCSSLVVISSALISVNGFLKTEHFSDFIFPDDELLVKRVFFRLSSSHVLTDASMRQCIALPSSLRPCTTLTKGELVKPFFLIERSSVCTYLDLNRRRHLRHPFRFFLHPCHLLYVPVVCPILIIVMLDEISR